MRKKAIILGIATLMLLGIFCCTIHSETDAATVSLTGMHFDTDDAQKSRNFTVNEGEYYGYSYTLSMGVAEITSGATTPTVNYVPLLEKTVQDTTGEDTELWNTTIQGGQISISADDNNKGAYNINVSKPTADYTLELRVSMTVIVGTVQTVMDPLFFRMDVTISGSTETNPVFNSMEFEVGRYDSFRISENGPPVLGSIDLYHWYAEGLPEGLSMSENGYISGIPEVSTDGTVAQLFIFGHEGNGEYMGEINIVVVAATNEPNTFDYTVSGGVSTSTNCYDYVAVQGDTVTLTITSSNPDATITVWSVYDDDYVTLSPTGTNQYTLTTDGTGCYKVIIQCGNETTYFHMYVVPEFDVVEAQIMISST